MDESARIASLPDGSPIDCERPVLTKTHCTRLRKLWSLGRPAHLPELGAMELDLIVHGLLESVVSTSNGWASAVVQVTKRGVAYINDARQSVIQAQRPHHDLASRLSLHLRSKGYLTWENISFPNPNEAAGRCWDTVRPDVYACLPSLRARNIQSAIYEVKVNRSDFLSDLAKPDKRKAYAELAEVVYYCCPQGMICKDEVPDGCGLIVESRPEVFDLVKRARRRKTFAIPLDTALTLMVKRGDDDAE